MDRILLTGATGVVGRHVLPLLVSAGHPVTAVSRTHEQAELLRAVGATPVSMDLFDPASVRSAVQGHDVVINLATHMPSSLFRMLLRRSWRENDRIRREGSATLASAAAATGVRRFIQESFAPIHEDGGADWIDERWPVRPAPYTARRSTPRHRSSATLGAGAPAWCSGSPGSTGRTRCSGRCWPGSGRAGRLSPGPPAPTGRPCHTRTPPPRSSPRWGCREGCTRSATTSP
ncbi:MAG: NAD-dependent epimerase/dehydratase family protein [Myxococcaceae bacterium]|nr:MAG: NAD-dependent epimerase/dehydratase family protein [Myxococcaceae bacterium]